MAFIGCTGHRRAEVEAGSQSEELEAQEHALGIEPGDRDVVDDERHERAEVAEGPGELGAIEPVAAERHARRALKAAP
jgi:hypothetical protein